MTQAYNLSQLANNLNSSGQLDATDGLVNAVPIANGGTGASTDSAARTNLNVPTRTGGDASGTWGINISGNAATATSATSATSASTANYANTAGNGGVTSVNGLTGAVTVASIGVGQTWQDLTASRAVNTTYTNSTGKPIMVQVSQWTYDNGAHGIFYVNGVQINDLFSIGGDGANTLQCHSVIVPNGSTYRVEGSTIVLWTELR